MHAQSLALNTLSRHTRYRDAAPGKLSALDPVRVLILSDFRGCLAIATLVHSIGRFSTRMTFSAASALSLAGAFGPEIVLLNTDLSDLEGFQVAAALRWRSGQSAPRMVAMTDDITACDRTRALASGFEQYLSLPMNRTALESVLVRRASRDSRPAGGLHSVN